MENPMGFAHFLANADFVARGVLALMLLASIGTWTLIVTKGFRLWRVYRKSSAFLSAFWAAPNLEAVAARIRESGAGEPFSHLVHHGFTAIEQNNRRQRGEARLLGEGGSVGAAQLGAVVTDVVSDWSTGQVDWVGRVVTVRASRSGDALTVRARVDEEPWRLVRLAPIDPTLSWSAGPMTCGPSRAGLTVRFTSWTTGPADTTLH